MRTPTFLNPVSVPASGNRNLPAELWSHINSFVMTWQQELKQLGVAPTTISELEGQLEGGDTALLVKRLKLYSQWQKYLVDAYGLEKTLAVNELDLTQLRLMSGITLSFSNRDEYFDCGDICYEYNIRKVFNIVQLAAFIGDAALLKSILEIKNHSETFSYAYKDNNLLRNLAILSGNSEAVKSLANRSDITFLKNRGHILSNLMLYSYLTFLILAAVGSVFILPPSIFVPMVGIIFAGLAAGLLVAIPLLALTFAMLREVWAKHFYQPKAEEDLKHAALSGNTALMQEYRAQIKTVPHEVLRYAVLSANLDAVRLALSWGLDVHQRDKHNRDLSFYAEQNNSFEVKGLIREQLASTATPRIATAARPQTYSASLWSGSARAVASSPLGRAGVVSNETTPLLAVPH